VERHGRSSSVDFSRACRPHAQGPQGHKGPTVPRVCRGRMQPDHLMDLSMDLIQVSLESLCVHVYLCMCMRSYALACRVVF
jgi:hypothetical protein